MSNGGGDSKKADTSNVTEAGIDLMDYEEEELAKSCSSLEQTQFDEIIGHIEDIIMDDRFQELQSEFMDKNYIEFEDNEENKFIYTDIHKEYISLLESYLEKSLSERLPDFSMEKFNKMIADGVGDSTSPIFEGEIFEMLATFTDFLAFKEMMLDYKQFKEGHVVDLSDAIKVTNFSCGQHTQTTGIDLCVQGQGDILDSSMNSVTNAESVISNTHTTEQSVNESNAENVPVKISTDSSTVIVTASTPTICGNSPTDSTERVNNHSVTKLN